MERATRISSFWNWLPAFRAVAEYGSIQRAALALHLSPSSLSRTVRILEEEIGVPLLVRTPAGVSLTEAGSELLRGTRDAMRRVDDALTLVDNGNRASNAWRIGASGSILARLVARATGGVARRSSEGALGKPPSLRLLAIASDRIAHDVACGLVDLVVTDASSVPSGEEELEAVEVGKLVFGIFAARRGDLPAVSDGPVVVPLGVSLDAGDAAISVASTLDGAETLAREVPMRACLPIVLAPPDFVALPSRVDLTQSVVVLQRKAVSSASTPWTGIVAEAIRELLRPSIAP